MSLRLSDFSQYALAGAQADYAEIRAGESYAAGIQIADNGTPVDITGWTFTTAYENFLATFDTTKAGGLNTITNIMQLSLTPIVDAGLIVTNIIPTQGRATLLLPVSVTSSGPASNVTPDSNQNVLVKLVWITVNFPEPNVTPTFTNVRLLPAAFIIRFGG